MPTGFIAGSTRREPCHTETRSSACTFFRMPSIAEAPLLQFVFVVAVIGTGNLVDQVGVAFLQDFQQ